MLIHFGVDICALCCQCRCFLPAFVICYSFAFVYRHLYLSSAIKCWFSCPPLQVVCDRARVRTLRPLSRVILALAKLTAGSICKSAYLLHKFGTKTNPCQQRLSQALPQTTQALCNGLLLVWAEQLGLHSPCCQKRVSYFLQSSFLLRVREELSQIIALYGGWLLAALRQSDYQRMGWFDIIYFVLMVYVLIHFLPLCPVCPLCYCWKARRFNQWWIKSARLSIQKRAFVWK